MKTRICRALMAGLVGIVMATSIDEAAMENVKSMKASL